MMLLSMFGEQRNGEKSLRSENDMAHQTDRLRIHFDCMAFGRCKANAIQHNHRESTM